MCEALKQIGVMEFSEADYVRFPIIDRSTPHPCAKVWGYDQRLKLVEAQEASPPN